jgi:tRNA1(Val) A37 N6-methylase TrmN6
MNHSHGIVNPAQAKAIARHEILCSLEDVIRETSRLLKPNGRFYLVHRPFRLAELMKALIDYKLEPKRMKLVYPYVDKEPNMVLMECIKGARSRLTVEAPLIVYKEQNVYTDEIYDIYGY